MIQFTKIFAKTIQCLLLATLLIALVGCQKGETGTVSVGTTTTTQEFTFEDEQTKEVSGPAITAGIEIPGYDALYIDYGSTEMAGDFFNPDDNNVYFRLSFWLDGEDEAFYESALIEPGQHIYYLEMDKTYDKGTYDMKIVYETFSTDGAFTPRNGANVACKLIVE